MWRRRAGAADRRRDRCPGKRILETPTAVENHTEGAADDPSLRSDALRNPTMGPNTSPFKGRDGTMLTGRQIGQRLERELETRIGMPPTPTGEWPRPTAGTGGSDLLGFIEMLRCEGFESEISKPEVKPGAGLRANGPVEEGQPAGRAEKSCCVPSRRSREAQAQTVDLINDGNATAALVGTCRRGRFWVCGPF